MKKLLLLASVFLLTFSLHAQGIKGILKKSRDSSGKIYIKKSATGNSAKGLSNNDIITGLKEALSIGAENSAKKLSATDGFFKEAAIKILMPVEAQKVEKNCG